MSVKSPEYSDAGNGFFPVPGSDITTYFPESESEFSELLRLAASGNIEVTVVGALTGLTGAGVPPDSGWRVDTTLFTEIPDRPGFRRLAPYLLLDENDSHYGLVAPGVPLHVLNETLRAHGLWYPPHPGETRALIGGNVSTNASGPRTFAFGATRSYVESLRVVLATGDVLDLRRGREKVTGRTFSVTTESGWGLKGEVPAYAMPKVKNASGLYALPEMDLIDLFIGSEGILGAFSEIGLRFLPHRDLRAEIFFFPTPEAALDFGDALRPLKADARRYPAPKVDGTFGITALEYFDVNSLRLAHEAGYPVPDTAGAAIEVEAFAGDTVTLMQIQGLADAFASVGTVPPDQTPAFRVAVPRRIADLLKERGRPKLGTDFSVPLEAFRELFRLYEDKATDFAAGRDGLYSAFWGHLGDGHLHFNFLSETAEDHARANRMYLELVRKAVSLGGAISAEHGVGKRSLVDEHGSRHPYLWYQFGDAYKEIAKVKKVFDPQGILNPGNMGI
jgi:D-lactate dehydrogenase (cytochrome)